MKSHENITKQSSTLPAVAGRSFLAPLIAGVTLRSHTLRIFLSILGAAIFFVVAVFGYCLLMTGKFSGAEFISLLIAFAVIGLILSFASEVQEFSLVGNIVKLKEVKKDAEKSINELKLARTETFRFLLSLAKRHPGGWGGSGVVDSRLADFWFLHEQIKNFGCEEELKNNIAEVADELLKGQVSSIANSSDNIGEKYRGNVIFPIPNNLIIEALETESVQKAADRKVCNGSTEEIKKNLMVGLQEYKKLYDLRESLK